MCLFCHIIQSIKRINPPCHNHCDKDNRKKHEHDCNKDDKKKHKHDCDKDRYYNEYDDYRENEYYGRKRHDHCDENEEGTQSHVHEFLGSTKLAEECDDRHNHRVAGVTSEAIPLPGGGHKHALLTNTDFFVNHHHELGTETGPAIDVGNGKHIHFVKARTTFDDGHFHQIVFATLIQDPIS
ncbi:hypothetical protein Curi_c13600 [Gottschalkia acidurici 9a]|uniref:YmaF family n=1 Tax=Gottschalkia acidurici (strain ATCC 7906 / DSM 604 / BCRC 14475 / CIP 104303 / KCTC 5404 / NCIMB 10678 / 9a) TaxID=1128398 RepID=K0B0C0_GOTA9|nr:YmaF family protein [Gottschalkia acidurici]AFS78370.1 hypothetical protein Curi_c13600 [Gottschalkia acidurici 9a]